MSGGPHEEAYMLQLRKGSSGHAMPLETKSSGSRWRLEAAQQQEAQEGQMGLIRHSAHGQHSTPVGAEEAAGDRGFARGTVRRPGSW